MISSSSTRRYGKERLAAIAVVAILGAMMALLLLGPVALAKGTATGRPVVPGPVGSPKSDGVHTLGYIPTPPGEYHKLSVPKLPGIMAIPTSVDLSAQLPPIGDQQYQSSCTAWATSYNYKTWSEKQEHTSWDLTNPTHQFSPSFIYNQINGGFDSGSIISMAFDCMVNKGDVDIAEMPFDPSDYRTQPTAAQYEAAKPYRIPADYGYLWIQWMFGPYNPPNPIDGAKAQLAGGKMLVVGIPVYNDWPDYGANPARAYYDYNETASFAGGHAVCVCGYDDNANPGGADADHRGGFKIVNSWGPSWNGSSHGFVYLSYDFVKRYAREAWSMNDITPDTPSISSLSANAGSIGTTVVINGDNFGTKRRAAKASFNGVDATDVSFTNGAVTAKVPVGAVSGPVRVFDWEGTATNSVSFTVLPTLGSLSPVYGAPGAQVTIGGTGFGANRGSRYVSFGAVQATDYVSWADTEIKCKVPSMSGGDAAVTVGGPDGTSNALQFLVEPVAAPAVTGITPATAAQGAAFDVTELAGTGFRQGATVRIELGGTVVNATDVAVVSTGKITCRLNLGGAPLGKYDVVVRNVDTREGRLAQGFSVTNVCGGGAGASLAVFGAVAGLLSLAGAGAGTVRRRRRR